MVKVSKIKIKANGPKVLLWGFFLLTLFSFSTSANSPLFLKWYGTTCVSITDGQSVILFDPYLSRPSFWSVLFGSEIKSDPALVRKYIGLFEEEKNKAIFISHTHFDHILDLQNLEQLWDYPQVYGPMNLKFIDATSENETRKNRKIMTTDKVISVGSFKISALQSQHSPLPLGFDFAKGKLSENINLPTSAYQLKAQESFAYLIKHPSGTILFQSGAVSRESYPVEYVDTLLIGIASRKDQDMKAGILKKLKAKKIIPIHFDNFFKPLSEHITHLPFMDSQGFEKLVGSERIHWPKLFEKIAL